MENPGPEAQGEGRGKSPVRLVFPVVRFLPLVSSCSALVLAFIGFAQLDLPIVHYVRSVTIHDPGEQLTVPWMAFVSHAGDWIGDGWRLIVVSVLLLGAGWLSKKPNLKAAGIETLMAHGISALVGHALKHLVGRPRPKFVHSGEWQFAPSLQSGWDSFPSGHTAGSFAVATVLAKRFPAFGLLVFGVAAFVALGRVLRGSHFPTDVFGGAVVGVLSGSLAATPWREWRSAIQEGLRQAAIGTVAVFALLWTATYPADARVTGTLFIGLGVSALAGGLWLRRFGFSHREKPATAWQERTSLALIAYGLAAMTTSPFVLAVAGFACLAFWSHDSKLSIEGEPQSSGLQLMKEGALIAGILLALTLLIAGRAVLPFR